MRTQFGKVCWLFPILLMSILLWRNAGNAQTNFSRIKSAEEYGGTRQVTQTSSSEFKEFVRLWVSHGAALNFSADGKAVFYKRVYRWCGPGVAQPCDTISSDGRISNGYQEQIQFSYVRGLVAYGTITASNFHPKGLAVTAILQPDDTLLYSGTSEIALLCGPKAPVGACGA